MKSGGRPVKATLKKWDGSKVVEEVHNATFHCWGYRKPKMKDDKPKVAGIETVAVVELGDGQVRLVNPDKMKFMDRGNNG